MSQWVGVPPPLHCSPMACIGATVVETFAVAAAVLIFLGWGTNSATSLSLCFRWRQYRTYVHDTARLWISVERFQQYKCINMIISSECECVRTNVHVYKINHTAAMFRFIWISYIEKDDFLKIWVDWVSLWCYNFNKQGKPSILIKLFPFFSNPKKASKLITFPS